MRNNKPPPSLATFTSITVTLAKQAALDLDRAQRDLERTVTSLHENMAVLEQRTNHFITEGWADLREYHSMPIHPFGGGYGHKCWSWSQYFRNLAKDMHRPFIHAHKRYSSPPTPSGVRLDIPRRKSLDILSAPFFLLDKNKQSHNTVEWQWWLEAEMFDWWCDQLKTDPKMKEALWR